MTADFRKTLTAAVVSQSPIIVHSEHKEIACIAFGIPVRVSRNEVLLVIVPQGPEQRGFSSSIPIEAIVDVELVEPCKRSVLDALAEDRARMADEASS